MRQKTRVWLKSIARALISGGAGSMATSLSVNIIEPSVFNLQDGLIKTLQLAGCAMVIGGFIAVSNYLQRSPLPEESQDLPLAIPDPSERAPSLPKVSDR